MTDIQEAAQEEEIIPVVEGEVSASPEVTATSDAPDLGEGSHVIEIDENQKVINKLAFEKREQKRRADELDNRVKELESQLSKPKVLQQVPVRPKEADFDYDDEKYQAALDQYHSDVVDFKLNQAMTDRQKIESRDVENRKRSELQAKFSKKITESKIAGYADAIASLPTFDPSVVDAIMEVDNGPKVAYYLSQHLDIADQLAMSSPIMAAIRIGEISARISGATKQTKPSAAPDPIDPINQGGSSVGSGVDPLIAGATFE